MNVHPETRRAHEILYFRFYVLEQNNGDIYLGFPICSMAGNHIVICFDDCNHCFQIFLDLIWHATK